MVDSNHPECTGCGACAASCPNHCIDIVIASSGEYRPAINTDNSVIYVIKYVLLRMML